MWECGLKPQNHIEELDEARVTPYVGVWIETWDPKTTNNPGRVTPYVGVWIETGDYPASE